MSDNIAKFAIVGHPNKGKSSIVSTLSQDDSIHISSRSGTTTESKGFHIDEEYCGYELIDTPGFQRPRKVLAWLQKRASSAEHRAQAVADFVVDPDCQRVFPDEVELLTPLVNGAAIVYVVDGSRPYGVEYEPEMEILRWSGQPSMALINPIESDLHIKPWKNALEQFFKIVRVFNPMEAEFENQIDLLKAFVLLKPSWTDHLESVMANLLSKRQRQHNTSGVILARLIEDLCLYQETQKVLDKEQAKVIQPLLEKKYKQWMVKREQKALKDLFTNYKHFQTQLSMDDLSLPHDLFDCEQWYLWGLSKTELITASTMAGSAVGTTLDIAVGGASLMAGAVGGGILGFASAWFGADKLVVSDVKGLPLGGYEASYGPMKNTNFPYVVIGRFIYIYQQISQRNHAKREAMTVESNALQEQINRLESTSLKSLHQMCSKLVKQKTVDMDKLSKIMLELF